MTTFRRILTVLLAVLFPAGLVGGVLSSLRFRAYRAEYEQALTLSDAVVSFIPLTKPVCTLPRLNYLNDYEHVLGVRITGLYHWISTAKNASLLMIGLQPSGRDPAAVTEGSWYGAAHECCLNRAYYDALLADPASGFTGVGGSLTVAEPILREGAYPRTRTFTVTGIVDEEKQYADPDVYGRYHIYASIDDVSIFFIGYSFQSSNKPTNDYNMYYAARVKDNCGVYAVRPDPDHAGEWQYRTTDGELLDRDGYAKLLEAAVVNAGFSVEIQLDSREAIEEFTRTLEEPLVRDLPSAAQQIALRRASNAPLPDWLLKLETDGEAEDWYIFTQKNLVRPVPQDTAEINARYVPLVHASLILSAACAAVSLASLAGLITLAVYRRKKEAPHV